MQTNAAVPNDPRIPRPGDIVSVSLDLVFERDDHVFPLDEVLVETLATEIKLIGLRTPIQAYRRKNQHQLWEYVVIAGRHRLRAVRRLRAEDPENFSTIAVQLVDEPSPEWLQFLELSENTTRRHLSLDERRNYAGKLLQLTEKLLPQRSDKSERLDTIAGRTKSDLSRKRCDAKSWLTELSETTGISAKTLARDWKRFQSSPEGLRYSTVTASRAAPAARKAFGAWLETAQSEKQDKAAKADADKADKAAAAKAKALDDAVASLQRAITTAAEKHGPAIISRINDWTSLRRSEIPNEELM